MTATVRCVHCDAPLSAAAHGFGQTRWSDPDGHTTCADGGWHKGVIVEKVA